MPDHPPQLQYQPAGVVARRKRLNRILTIYVSAYLAILLFLLGPAAFKRARIIYAKHRCATYAYPLNTPVLWVNEKGLFAANPNPYFDYIDNSDGNFPYRAPAFLHMRRSPHGLPRLVWVRFETLMSFGGTYDFLGPQVKVFKLGSWMDVPKEIVRGPLNTSKAKIGAEDNRYIVYAGQADPEDESHFIVTIKVASGIAVIDGWLRDDDTVEFEARVPTSIPAPTSSPALSP